MLPVADDVDGGGIRGLSILFNLKEILFQLCKLEQHGDEDAMEMNGLRKPCEVFDFIGGTGTGGCVFDCSLTLADDA